MAKTFADNATCMTCGWHTGQSDPSGLTRAEHKRITAAAWRHMAGTGHMVYVTLVRIYRPSGKRRSPYRPAPTVKAKR